jgi:SAM-dependent methyltransferase
MIQTPALRTAEFYDAEWPSQWRDMRAYSPVARHTRRLIGRYLDRVRYRSLVDIGCGNGALLRDLELNAEEVDICGVDFSEVAVESARRATSGRFACLDIESEALPEAFDVGVCSEVLEHLGDDEAALANIRSMCRHVVITVPSGPLGPSSVAMGHVRHYTKADLAAKLTRAGFKVIALRAWGTPFHDPLYAWLRGKAPEGATTGRYGLGRRALSSALYLLFFLNLLDRGHKLVALAERAA